MNDLVQDYPLNAWYTVDNCSSYADLISLMKVNWVTREFCHSIKREREREREGRMKMRVQVKVGDVEENVPRCKRACFHSIATLLMYC